MLSLFQGFTYGELGLFPAFAGLLILIFSEDSQTKEKIDCDENKLLLNEKTYLLEK